MTPEDAKKVADLRMRILTGLRDGKQLKDIVTREEIQAAVAITREARRQAPVMQEAAKKSKKSAATPGVQVDLDTLLGELGE